MFYLLTFIKLIIGLIMAIAIIKTTGKTTLAPQSPLDQIQNYILGGIIGGAIYSSGVSVLQLIFIMSIWALISNTFYFVKNRFSFFSLAIDGESINLIKKGKISQNEFKKSNLTIEQLYSMMRVQGIDSITSIENGVIEKNGSLSVIRKSSVEKKFAVITDGVINHSEIENSSFSEDKIINIIRSQGTTSVDEIFILEMDEKGKIIYLEKYEK